MKNSNIKAVPSVSVTYSQNGSSKKSNELGMHVMQELAYEKRGERYLLIKSPLRQLHTNMRFYRKPIHIMKFSRELFIFVSADANFFTSRTF
jgi:hypothetical protein